MHNAGLRLLILISYRYIRKEQYDLWLECYKSISLEFWKNKINHSCHIYFIYAEESLKHFHLMLSFTTLRLYNTDASLMHFMT